MHAMKRPPQILLCLMILSLSLTLLTRADAEVIRWHYSGQLAIVDDPHGVFAGLQPGDPIEGHFQYDTDADSQVIPGLATLFFMGEPEGYIGFDGISLTATNPRTGETFEPTLAAAPVLDYSILTTDGPDGTIITSATGELQLWDGYQGLTPILSLGLISETPLATSSLPTELDLNELLAVFVIVEDLEATSPVGSLDADVFELTRVELLPGDFDTDFVLSGNDIDILSQAIAASSQRSFYDMNADTAVDEADRVAWVDTLNTYFGDSNLDGEFNSGDLIAVFTAGEYEDAIAINSRWATGDWNGDREFDSGDLIVAFQGGGYEQGPRPTASAIPEPSSATLLVPLLASMCSYRFRRWQAGRDT
jgi:hypothetical protein